MREINANEELRKAKDIAFRTLDKLGKGQLKAKMSFMWEPKKFDVFGHAKYYTRSKRSEIALAAAVWPYLTEEQKEMIVKHEVAHIVAENQVAHLNFEAGHSFIWKGIAHRAGISNPTETVALTEEEDEAFQEDLLDEYGPEDASKILRQNALI